jgi:flagellar protein FlgJ
MAVEGSGGGQGPIQFNRFRRLREPLTPAQQDQKLKDVSKLYEKQFLGEMLKAMRSTVSESEFVKANQAEKIFREQLDQQYVDKWGDNGGIGLSNLIYQQLLEKLGPSLGITMPPSRPHGPLPLDAKSQFHGSVTTAENGKAVVQYERDLQKAALGEPLAVTMPWKGDVLGVKKLDFDEYFLDMQHDNGLKSQITFRGQLAEPLAQAWRGSEGKPRLTLGEGSNLCVLSPGARRMFWTVEPLSKPAEAATATSESNEKVR